MSSLEIGVVTLASLEGEHGCVMARWIGDRMSNFVAVIIDNEGNPNAARHALNSFMHEIKLP